jgi:predicted nicotinamide N-methyase
MNQDCAKTHRLLGPIFQVLTFFTDHHAKYLRRTLFHESSNTAVMNELGKSLHQERLQRQQPTWTSMTIKGANPSPHGTKIQISEQPGLYIGSIIWDGSEILLQYLLTVLPHDSSIRFLELGAGTGLLGLGLLAALPTVTGLLTDKETHVLEINVARNLDLVPRASVRALVWGTEIQEIQQHAIEGAGHQETQQHAAEGTEQQEKTQQHATKESNYDVLLASDVLYSEECVAPLFHTVNQLITGATIFYLCYKIRDEAAEAVFFTLCRQAGLVFEDVHRKEEHTIYRMQRSNAARGKMN